MRADASREMEHSAGYRVRGIGLLAIVAIIAALVSSQP